MRKIFTTLALALMTATAGAQFFTPTSYKGAFAPAPTAMWTQGWCEWDPQNANYPAPTVTVNADITGNQTWSTGQTVLLQGPVYVTNNAVLTIQPGVIVRGAKAIAGSGLFITRGAQLVANGTATAPIVFTSDQAPGSRAIGDWGGVIMMGNAVINFSAGVNTIEGVSPTNTANAVYGGNNDNDNSGSLTWARIEFGGYVYQPNKEINGLTMGGVGKATTIHHVQVSFTNDDGFEWFGGTVDGKYLVSYRNLDDDFDTDNGWRGNVQYGLIVRDPNLADNPAVSTSEGFESDNDASGTAATPLTSGVFSNITMIGPYRGSNTNTIAAGYRRALRIRRNSNLKIYNSIFMDTQRGVYIDGSLCDQAATAGTSGTSTVGIKFKNNIVAGTQNGRITETSTSYSITQWFAANANDSITNANPTFTNILVTPYNYTSPDYRPGGTSPALSGASFTDAVIAALTGTGTGISEEKKEIGWVLLYPNPANAQLNMIINAETGSDIKIGIYDVTGRLAAAVSESARIEQGMNEFRIDTAYLYAGVYFVTVESRAGKESMKLIVTH